MIRDKGNVAIRLTRIITNDVSRINTIYRSGPSLHFYHRILDLRRQHPSVASFLSSDNCIELLYATLVSWDMNGRGAKLKDYLDFKSNLMANMTAFQAVETAAPKFTWAKNREMLQALAALYSSLALMKTEGKLVSNSKCIHYLFPSYCLPMDRTNTLQKLYGNTMESKNKFLEILEFSYEVIESIQNPRQYLDDHWNTSEMKLVDNAIIMM
jgi:hypothetical protein